MQSSVRIYNNLKTIIVDEKIYSNPINYIQFKRWRAYKRRIKRRYSGYRIIEGGDWIISFPQSKKLLILYNKTNMIEMVYVLHDV